MSKQLSLKELKGRLGQTQGEPQNQCGSKEHLILSEVDRGANTYLAVMTLRRNGLSLTKAKRSVDSALAGKPVAIIVPKVENPNELMRELTGYGIRAHLVTPKKEYSVKQLRRRLGFTQEQFSVLYGVEMRTLQNYENGSRRPDGSTVAYFEMIERDPEITKRGLNEEPLLPEPSS
ncbi:helix-turn-helix domain-containing protein [Ruegeria hyattellae]|uniref:helix-turn-helix domain-containing protein n=1 Tax=Ruegeria hyattellae TaxID=3233337 RepID=UPI00355B3BB6